MGTRCTLTAFHSDEARVDLAMASALAEVGRLDRLLTTWLPDSEVSRINAAAGTGEWVFVSSETFEVLEKAQWVAELSGGAFDITVGVFKGLWKFDQDNDGSIPREEDVAARLRLVNYRDVLLDESRRSARLRRAGQRITLGGVAKGLVVDRAVEKLRQVGLRDFVMQAGGDLFAAGRRGARAWRAGIHDPRTPVGNPRSATTSFAVLGLEDSAFNTSGDYERFVIRDDKRYHHILDPKTGHPVTHTRSVTVLAPTSFLADTLDTALFVMGWKKAMALVEKLPDVEAVIVDSRNRVHMSSGLQGRLKITRAPTDGI